MSRFPSLVAGILLAGAAFVAMGQNFTSPIPANLSAPISISATSSPTTTQLIAAPSLTTQAIWVMQVNFLSGGTVSTWQFVTGTGTNCATGQTNITGNYAPSSQSGASIGDGVAAIWSVPAGNAVCVTATAGSTTNVGGSIAYRVL